MAVTGRYNGTTAIHFPFACHKIYDTTESFLNHPRDERYRYSPIGAHSGIFRRILHIFSHDYSCYGMTAVE